MTAKPIFHKVLTADVERVGAAAAILLAVVRYRTNNDADWRASYAEISKQTGLDRWCVIPALKRLENRGELLVQPGSDTDRTKSYRLPADQSFQDLPTPADQSFQDLPTPEPGGVGNPAQGWEGLPTAGVGNPANAPISKNKKERRGEAGAAVQAPLPHVVADSRNASTPQNSLSENNGHGSGKGFDWLGRPKYCPTHMPNDPGKPCHGCKDVRLENERLDGLRVHDVFEEVKQFEQRKKLAPKIVEIERGEFTGTGVVTAETAEAQETATRKQRQTA